MRAGTKKELGMSLGATVTREEPDTRDMYRMGKSQQFKVYLKPEQSA
jgi:hypothetical protein